MKKLWLIVLCFSCFCTVTAQEICDNGIDDDGDGLIDFNDLDCDCSLNEDLLFIRNPSFEKRSCCPEHLAEINCVNDWLQGSDGTTDYFNTCTVIKNDAVPPPPKPLPDGQGVIGFASATIDRSVSLDEYKEYLGICLSNPLMKDSLYRWDFFLGFAKQEEDKAISVSPVEIILYGTNQCMDLPFSGTHCPLANWTELSKVTVTGEEEWTKNSLIFVPSKNIQAILVGLGCQEIEGGVFYYYFLDKVLLVKENESYLTGNIHVLSGFPCTENVILAADFALNSSYQWYFNKIAIPNATGTTFSIPRGIEAEGDYYVKIKNEEHCVFSSPYTYKIDGFPIAGLGQDTIICDNSPLTLGHKNIGTDFFWNTGEITPTIKINTSGTYIVTVSNECGEAVDKIIVSEESTQLACELQVPNIFTPNQDGINDTFSPITSCCLISFDFSVYNRWGRLVFQTNDIEQTWNGRYNGQIAPSDVYIWQIAITYQIEGEEKSYIENGDVTLVR